MEDKTLTKIIRKKVIYAEIKAKEQEYKRIQSQINNLEQAKKDIGFQVQKMLDECQQIAEWLDERSLNIEINLENNHGNRIIGIEDVERKLVDFRKLLKERGMGYEWDYINDFKTFRISFWYLGTNYKQDGCVYTKSVIGNIFEVQHNMLIKVISELKKYNKP